VHGVVDERHPVQQAVHVIEQRRLDPRGALALGGIALPRLEPRARFRPEAPAVDLDQARRD